MELPQDSTIEIFRQSGRERVPVNEVCAAVTSVGARRQARLRRLCILHPALENGVFYDRNSAGDAELSHCIGLVDLDRLYT